VTGRNPAGLYHVTAARAPGGGSATPDARPRQAPTAAGSPPAPIPVTHSSPAVLLFMSLFGGGSSGSQQDGWRQARSVLLDVDERIAATPTLRYLVRAFRAAPKVQHSELRPAGQLSRRDLRRPDRSLDFGPLLHAVLTTLTMDMRTSLRASVIAARPAVIFFPVTAPLADAVSMRAYTELTERALVLWIVSAEVNRLISPDFGIGGARTFVDRPDVSEEIAELLVAHANVRGGDADPHRSQAPPA
jgi:hypothetical protein